MATSPTPASPTGSGKKLVNTKGGLRMISVNEEERSPFELEEPHWDIDSEHIICNKCGKKFSFTSRRHHCRRCGKIFCNSCCDAKVSLPRLAFVDPQRVCKDCEPIARKEEEFYQKHIRILQNGAEFVVNDTEPLIFKCFLNHKTHRDLCFECVNNEHEAAHEPVNLADVIAMQCLTDSMHQSPDGSAQLVGIVLKYNKNQTTEEVKFQIPNEANVSKKKESLTFLLVLQKAMKMLFEVN